MDNFDLKKYLVENKVTTNSRMLEVEMGMVPADVTGKDSYDGALPAGVKGDIKKFFDDFFNSSEAINFAKKIVAKMSPEDKQAFLKSELNEDFHDTIRSLGGYKPGQEPTLVDDIVGRILKTFGQLGFMSGGLITPLVIAALDAFGGTSIGQQIGFGGMVVSIIATYIGGGLITLIGKILQNDRDTDMLS
jgi:hypothetical protein